MLSRARVARENNCAKKWSIIWPVPVAPHTLIRHTPAASSTGRAAACGPFLGLTNEFTRVGAKPQTSCPRGPVRISGHVN